MSKLTQQKNQERMSNGILKLHIAAKMWSDNFYLSSGNKNNRNYIWICTLSFNNQDMLYLL
eukprot:6922453-Ditylum_brightwellii.AAC.1